MSEISGVRQIIGEALDKIYERAEKLERVHSQTGGELAEAKAITKAIEKALGPKTASNRQPPPRLPPGESPRSRFTAKVVTLLEDGNGRTPQSIADQFGAKLDWVQNVLTQAVARNQLVIRDGAYHAPGA